jgi:hypothetical protein
MPRVVQMTGRVVPNAAHVRQPRRGISRIWCLPSSSGCSFQARTGSLQPAWRRTSVVTFVATRVHRPQVPARTLPGVHSGREGAEVPMRRAGCYFPAVRPGLGQSMCSTALPPMRRAGRASIASAGWRQEHSSSTWASRRPAAARAHRRARSLGPLACAVSSPGRSSVQIRALRRGRICSVSRRPRSAACPTPWVATRLLSRSFRAYARPAHSQLGRCSRFASVTANDSAHLPVLAWIWHGPGRGLGGDLRHACP